MTALIATGHSIDQKNDDVKGSFRPQAAILEYPLTINSKTDIVTTFDVVTASPNSGRRPGFHHHSYTSRGGCSRPTRLLRLGSWQRCQRRQIQLRVA